MVRQALKVCAAALLAIGTTMGLCSAAEAVIYTPLDYSNDPSISTFARGINDSGQVVGIIAPQGTAPHIGFLWTSGTFTTFAFPGAQQTNATDINNAGVIAGTYNLIGQSVTHGFILSGGIFTTIDVP